MDLISRKDAVSRISDLLILELKGKRIPTWNEVYNAIGDIPSVPAVPIEIDETPTAGGWISVKDRLPEKSGQYLCWFGANKVAIGMAIVTYVDEWKAFGRLKSLEKYPNITHWMPLPEPPNPAEEPAVHEVRKDATT